jgi:hypothetical protein
MTPKYDVKYLPQTSFETAHVNHKMKTAADHTQCASQNPQASLLGLTTKLRLQIFSYLAEPVRFHIDSVHQDPDPRRWTFEHKRLCHTPDPVHPSLCSTPRFSGLTPTASMCHAQFGKPTNRHAIRAVCKLFCYETNDVFGDQVIGMTIEHRTVEARSILRSMSALQLAMLVDLTIQVLPLPKDGPLYLRWPPGGGSIAIVLVHLRKNFFAFPNLRTIAIQQPKRLRPKRHDRFEAWYSFNPEGEWRRQWYIFELKETYGDRVQIILEWWFVLREGHVRCSSEGDEMVRTRGVVGDCDSLVCRCEFETSSEPIIRERGEWMDCWKTRGMGFDKKYSLTRSTYMDERDWTKTKQRGCRDCHCHDARLVVAWEASARGHLRQVQQQVRCKRHIRLDQLSL